MINFDQVIEEIKQITVQYRREVGSARKPWPSSIRARVEQLIAGGLSPKEVSEATGVPYFSILHWRSRERKKFHTLTVQQNGRASKAARLPATVTVAGASEAKTSAVIAPAAVAVTTPDGFAINVEGIDVAIEL